jgi:hypothetical protein
VAGEGTYSDQDGVAFEEFLMVLSR